MYTRHIWSERDNCTTLPRPWRASQTSVADPERRQALLSARPISDNRDIAECNSDTTINTVVISQCRCCRRPLLLLTWLRRRVLLRWRNNNDNDDDESNNFGWLRSTVGGTPVFGRRTHPVLRSSCSRRVTTMWVNRPLQVSQLGQLSLSSFRGR